MADDVVLLRVDFAGAKTQKEVEALSRAVQKVRKESELGSQKFIQAARLEAEIKNKLHALNSQAYSDNAKLKESYFKLGHEIRSMRVASLQTAGALGLDKGGLGAALSALASPGGIIAGAITAGALWVKSLHDQAVEATNASLAVDKYGDKLARFKTEKVGVGKAESEVEELRFQMMSPQAQANVLRGRIGAYESAKRPARENLTLLGRAASYRAEAQYLRDVIALKALNKKMNDEELQQTKEFDRLMDEKHRKMFVGPMPGGVDRAGRSAAFRGRTPANWMVDVPTNEEVGAGMFPERANKSMDAIRDGAIEAGQAIKTHIFGSLTQSLGVGEQLALTLFGTALRIGLSFIPGGSAFAGLIPFAKGGIVSEPTYMVGMKSGKRGIMGEAGPERIIPMTGKNAGRGDATASAIRYLGNMIRSGVWHFDGRQLVYAVDHGRRSFNAGSM